MNISFDWLTRFVPHGKGAEQLRDLITAHVATVEGFERLKAELAPFVVARVVESEKIPETKLSANKVDDGSGTLLDVVCGAPNVTAGKLYPFARTGTVMPAGLKIEKKKIRGHTSNGMLCSGRELGLSEDHAGLLELDTDAAPGTALLDVLRIGDIRLTVDVLPNRPDLLSHLGMAREISAITGVTLSGPIELGDLPPVPEQKAHGATEATAGGITVKVEDTRDCPRFCAAVIRDVTITPSPEWLRATIEAVGGRSINNVVDATNYMLHGFGLPMHAYDRATLGGDTLVARRARAGEKLITLDGHERALDPDVLVIADAQKPSGIAGVMGGQGSEVSDATTDVVLEVAAFNPKLVRGSRKKAGLSTDASYRFERGIDEAMVPQALALGAALIAHLGGGHVEALIDVGHAPKPKAPVTLRVPRVARVLGAAISRDLCIQYLAALGCDITVDGETLRCTPPSWRHDLLGEIDLIEEIARLHGFDAFPDTLEHARPGTVPDHPMWSAYQRVRSAMVAAGLHEVRPLPFTNGKANLGQRVALVRVQNPLAEDEPFLRASVLDSLARRAEYNLNRMQGNVRLFEVGAVFAAQAGGSPMEEIHAGVLVMGQRRPPHFSEASPPAFDAWDVKALAEELARVAFQGATAEFEPGDGEVLWHIVIGAGRVGRVVRVALDAPVWASPAFGVELTLGAMPNAAVAPSGQHAHGARGRKSGVAPSVENAVERPPVRYKPLPTTPPAPFDLALLVPDGTTSKQVEDVLRSAAGELLESLELFDEFRGQGIPAGTRSLAWRLTFRHPERTLRDKEIEGRRSQLLKALEDQLSVRPRTA